MGIVTLWQSLVYSFQIDLSYSAFLNPTLTILAVFPQERSKHLELRGLLTLRKGAHIALE